jgi:hypothetical protein
MKTPEKGAQQMFDANGDYIYEHDLEAGQWDGHSYDCSFPTLPCDCEAAFSDFNSWAWIDEDDNFHEFLEDEDVDQEDDWVDFFTYVEGR